VHPNVRKVTVIFEVRINIKERILKKYNNFGKYIYKTYACMATYLYLWNDKTCVTAAMRGTQEIENQLTKKVGKTWI
jgi:hypothetical protein